MVSVAGHVRLPLRTARVRRIGAGEASQDSVRAVCEQVRPQHDAERENAGVPRTQAGGRRRQLRTVAPGGGAGRRSSAELREQPSAVPRRGASRGLDRRDSEGECSEGRHRDRAGRLHHGHSPFFSSLRSVNLRNPTGKARWCASDSAELFALLPIRNRSGCRFAPTIDTCGIRSASAHTGAALCAPPWSPWRSP